jgi:phosphatidylinositol alpha-1,6-mannosyltransferase
MRSTYLYCGFESTRPGNGGVCRVARLISRVLADEQALGRCIVEGTVLSDLVPTPDIGLNLRLAMGSRPQYVASANIALLKNTHFIYDCGGMARAHQWLPYPVRPSLVFMHGIEVWQGTSHSQQVLSLLRANRRIANTSYTRDRAAQLYPKMADSDVCWLATEADDPPLPKASESRPNVLILSRLDRYKGHVELIRCWPIVLNAIPDATLTIVGKGPFEQIYRKLAIETGLTEQQIEFTGFVPDDRIGEYWRRATIFAMPSRGEGFGLVYIEAMRYGIPVIGSIHDAAVEVNIDGLTGYNVNLEILDELPTRIISLLRDRDLAAQMGSNGMARWAQHFRFSSFRDRFLPLFRKWIDE